MTSSNATVFDSDNDSSSDEDDDILTSSATQGIGVISLLLYTCTIPASAA